MYFILNSKKRDIPWNFLNFSKLFLTCVLIILSFGDLVTNIAYSETEEISVYNVDLYTPVIKILSFVSIIVGILLIVLELLCHSLRNVWQ